MVTGTAEHYIVYMTKKAGCDSTATATSYGSSQPEQLTILPEIVCLDQWKLYYTTDDILDV